MDTVRVDICYRPLRIAWAIHSSDREAFRKAVRRTNTMWGGRFNPIVLVDRDDAAQLVELYRADVIVPVGDREDVKEFPKRFPHLIDPFFPSALYVKDGKGGTRARVLDIQNALYHWRNTPEWKAIDAQGVRQFVFDADDPLADAFLVQYGDYPDPKEIGIDYADILTQATMAIQCRIEKTAPIPIDTLDHPGYSFIARLGLRRHYSIRAGWDHAGFFVGDARGIDDLVTFWNLRAADIQLQFIDPEHLGRYAIIKPEFEKRTVAHLADLDEHRRQIAIWSRSENTEEVLKPFSGQPLTACRVGGPFFWNGGAVRPPMMMFGEASSLGVFGQEHGKPKVSFALNAKPFSADNWFYSQHLVASVKLLGSDEQHTFHPPYVPEWNEFFAREMALHYNRLRIEPERIGLVIDATSHDAFLYGLPSAALVEKLFDAAQLDAKLSGGGLITRQLIARLGGLNGARVFKIPGVRRLLKQHGPRDAFTRNAALQFIGKKDPDNPQASFEEHKHLYIEPRAHGTELTAGMVFDYMVEKGLFRIGATLKCPTCNLANWIALDVLKQSNVCEMCGNEFDATRQLVNGQFHYRRTGVLGLEKNSQGAVPVTLVLQQLEVNVKGSLQNAVFAPSYDLVPRAGVNLPPCEVDLVMMLPRTFPDKAEVILGECKDEGGHIDANDIANLRRIADALPANRFEVYILLAKLAPFSAEEIALARSLNGPYQRRMILLTARELEPYHIYERTQKELGITSYGGSPEELAAVTDHIYFAAQPASGAQPAPGAQLATGTYSLLGDL
jgi:hypothetical protein